MKHKLISILIEFNDRIISVGPLSRPDRLKPLGRVAQQRSHSNIMQ
jgi:hypothetical protein